MKNQVNPELSIIVAVYNEDPRNLLKLIDRLELVLRPEKVNYELIFVNDGSREPTPTARQTTGGERGNFRVAVPAKIFGGRAGFTAGLDHAEGLAVVNMDSDLQDPPELIPAMLEKWKDGYDVVYATRSKRRDRFSKRLTAFLFYRFLGAISSVQIPWYAGDFRLMDRVVVDALKRMPEKTRFIRGMIPWLGFKQCGVPLDRDAREIGESAYTVKKLLCLALDGILSFSVAPLFFISGFGLTVTLASFAALILSLSISGFNLNNFALLSGMGIFTGMQIMIMGIVSVYLSKILDETRARPSYVVARRVGGGFAQSEYDIESGADEAALIQNRNNSARSVL